MDKDGAERRLQTALARRNFGPGRLPPCLIRSMAEVKLACVTAAEKASPSLPDDVRESLTEALREIISGSHDDLFDLPLKQGGAGTSVNMAVNETTAVLAEDICKEKAGKSVKIDPIETVNRFQSTNDVFPTAVTIAAFRHLEETEKQVIELQETLVRLEDGFPGRYTTGRTQLQDGLPMGAGQLFGSWAGAIQRDRWRLHKLTDRFRTVALGGTAIGTCFNAPAAYIFEAEKQLREITGLPLSRSQNLPDEISNLDKYSELASGYRLCAENLIKISGDLLLLSSSFIGEIKHPEVQYGSSIMAAKVNPVLLEAVRGHALNVVGEAGKVSLYAQNGQLQLNAYLPFLADALFAARDSLGTALDLLTGRFLKEMTVETGIMEYHLAGSKALINALLPVLGYNTLKKITPLLEERKPATLDEALDIITAESGADRTALENQIRTVSMKRNT